MEERAFPRFTFSRQSISIRCTKLWARYPKPNVVREAANRRWQKAFAEFIAPSFFSSAHTRTSSPLFCGSTFALRAQFWVRRLRSVLQSRRA